MKGCSRGRGNESANEMANDGVVLVVDAVSVAAVGIVAAVEVASIIREVNQKDKCCVKKVVQDAGFGKGVFSD